MTRISHPSSPKAQTLHAIEMQLMPITSEVLHPLVSRLLQYCDYSHAQWVRCVETLSVYPEDLLSAAYHHVIHRPVHNFDQMLESMQSFMGPEMRYRKTRYDYFISALKESV
jgi:hypothetical protein